VKPWRTRYRWRLILACLALLVAISWLQLSGPQGRLREWYDRIRLGMTPAEVAAVVGGLPPNTTETTSVSGPVYINNVYGFCDLVAQESDGLPSNESDLVVYVWTDQSVEIWVAYRDSKINRKEMYTQVPPWKVKARACVDWLRRLVGWSSGR
jgi:hypothetical protein